MKSLNYILLLISLSSAEGVCVWGLFILRSPPSAALMRGLTDLDVGQKLVPQGSRIMDLLIYLMLFLLKNFFGYFF